MASFSSRFRMKPTTALLLAAAAAFTAVTAQTIKTPIKPLRITTQLKPQYRNNETITLRLEPWSATSLVFSSFMIKFFLKNVDAGENQARYLVDGFALNTVGENETMSYSAGSETDIVLPTGVVWTTGCRRCRLIIEMTQSVLDNNDDRVLIVARTLSRTFEIAATEEPKYPNPIDLKTTFPAVKTGIKQEGNNDVPFTTNGKMKLTRDNTKVFVAVVNMDTSFALEYAPTIGSTPNLLEMPRTGFWYEEGCKRCRLYLRFVDVASKAVIGSTVSEEFVILPAAKPTNTLETLAPNAAVVDMEPNASSGAKNNDGVQSDAVANAGIRLSASHWLSLVTLFVTMLFFK